MLCNPVFTIEGKSQLSIPCGISAAALSAVPLALDCEPVHKPVSLTFSKLSYDARKSKWHVACLLYGFVVLEHVM